MPICFSALITFSGIKTLELLATVPVSDVTPANMIGLIISFVFSLFSFSLGVSQAVFLAKYDHLASGCYDLWDWILAACIFNICGSAFSLATSVQYHVDPKSSHGITSALSGLTSLGQTIVSIWSVVAFFQIDVSCQSFWVSSAPELWTFTVIHFSLFWIMLGLLVLAMAYYTTVLLCKK